MDVGFKQCESERRGIEALSMGLGVLIEYEKLVIRQNPSDARLSDCA